jgi:hypothetical protein
MSTEDQEPEEETEPPTAELSAYADYIKSLPLDDLVGEGYVMSRHVKDFEARKEMVAHRIRAALQDAGFQKGQAYITETGVSATLQTKKNPDRISREKLIALNVALDTIAEATIPGGESAPFIKITVPRGKKGATVAPSARSASVPSSSPRT